MSNIIAFFIQVQRFFRTVRFEKEEENNSYIERFGLKHKFVWY
jgi:hypothetical protein